MFKSHVSCYVLIYSPSLFPMHLFLIHQLLYLSKHVRLFSFFSSCGKKCGNLHENMTLRVLFHVWNVTVSPLLNRSDVFIVTICSGRRRRRAEFMCELRASCRNTSIGIFVVMNGTVKLFLIVHRFNEWCYYILFQ